jgi:hypothetical protein
LNILCIFSDWFFDPVFFQFRFFGSTGSTTDPVLVTLVPIDKFLGSRPEVLADRCNADLWYQQTYLADLRYQWIDLVDLRYQWTDLVNMRYQQVDLVDLRYQQDRSSRSEVPMDRSSADLRYQWTNLV